MWVYARFHLTKCKVNAEDLQIKKNKQFYRMVYYIIHKCSNNNTFGALSIRFALKILLKTLVYAQFCSKFKFQHFYPLLFECHTCAINPGSWIWGVCMWKLVWVVCHKFYDVKLFIPWFGELYDTYCELTSTIWYEPILTG